MAASGNSFEGASACPFVALELDRDKRSDRPDYRHRCFAEPDPAPRSIAHQEAYCLSPNFSACPIFQDWALRAAARPVGAPPPEVTANAALTAAAAAAGVADPDSLTARPEPSIEDELPPLDDWQPPMQDEMPPPDDELPPVEAQQLSAFDEPGAQTSLPGALTAPELEAQQPGWDEPAAAYADTTDATVTPGYVPPPARRDDPAPLPEEAAVPAFLAGRAAQRPSTALPPPQSVDHVTREDLVPSWEIDGRYGAEGPEDPGGGGNRFDNILTAIAVIAILALGVAGVLFLPGLLAGGPGGQRTPPPSVVVPSFLPSAEPSLAATLGPTTAPQTALPTAVPTAVVTPDASPRFYRIRAGDTLFRIARRFDTTVEAILAANPEISDPNDIFAGQVIIIPQS